MRKIIITANKSWRFIEDWNHAKWRLTVEIDGKFTCRHHNIDVRFDNIWLFLEAMYGKSQIGSFVNYEVEIRTL